MRLDLVSIRFGDGDMRRNNPPTVNRLTSAEMNYAAPGTSNARIHLDLIGGINDYMPNMSTHTKRSDLQDEQIKMLTRCHTIAEINSVRNKFSKFSHRDGAQQQQQQWQPAPRKKGFPPIVLNGAPYSTAARFNEYSVTPRLNRQREKLREIQEEMSNIKHIPNVGSKMAFRRLEGYELRGSKISNLDRTLPEATETNATNGKATSVDKQGNYFPTPTAMRKAIESYKDKKHVKYSEERHVRHLDKEGKSAAVTAYIKKQINQKRLQQRTYSDDNPNGNLKQGLSPNKKQSVQAKNGIIHDKQSNTNGVNTYIVKDYSERVMNIPGNTTFNLTIKNLEIYDFITNPRNHDEDDEDEEGYVDERVIAWVMDRQVDPNNLKNIPEELDSGILPSLTESQVEWNTVTDVAVDDEELDVNTIYSPSRATTTT